MTPVTLKLVVGDAFVEAHLAQLRLQQAESREWIRAIGVNDNPFRAGRRLLGAGGTTGRATSGVAAACREAPARR